MVTSGGAAGTLLVIAGGGAGTSLGTMSEADGAGTAGRGWGAGVVDWVNRGMGGTSTGVTSAGAWTMIGASGESSDADPIVTPTAPTAPATASTAIGIIMVARIPSSVGAGGDGPMSTT